MDGLKSFGKNVEQIDSLANTVNISSGDIGMEFSIKKCGILRLKRGTVARSEKIELPNGEVTRDVKQEGYTYLENVELDKIKEDETKDKIIREYTRRVRFILRSKLNGRNKITAINTWAVAVVRFAAGLLNWKDREIKCFEDKIIDKRRQNGIIVDIAVPSDG